MTTVLAWASKVRPLFCTKVRDLANELLMPEFGASWLMACIAFETAETFSPSVTNSAGSGAVGLIQFMPPTARSLDTTVTALSRMTALEQLYYVRRYFLPYKGRLNTLSDVYMAILWPRAVGKPEDYVLWDSVTRPTTYIQNCRLDLDMNGIITKAEATAKVMGKLQRGLSPAFSA